MFCQNLRVSVYPLPELNSLSELRDLESEILPAGYSRLTSHSGRI